LRTETDAKLSSAPTPAAAPHGCGTRRCRESLGPDSRVLRLDGAANAPFEAFGAKLFSRGESAATAANAAAKTGVDGAQRAREQQNSKPSKVNKTSNSSAFPRCRDFSACENAARAFFGA
jgi:hypothetical protein